MIDNEIVINLYRVFIFHEWKLAKYKDTVYLDTGNMLDSFSIEEYYNFIQDYATNNIKEYKRYFGPIYNKRKGY